MGGFLSALFTGSNPTLNKDINQSGALSGYSTGIGEGDTTLASDYWRNLLGDPAQQAKAIAPITSAQQGQQQQQLNQIQQFGNRSGGTGAAAQAIPAQGRANIINLLGGLQTTAASNLGRLGTTNLGLAADTNQLQAQQSQQRQQNMLNSILGKGISAGIGGLESYGLGAGLPALGTFLSGSGGPAAPASINAGTTATAQLPGAISGSTVPYGGYTPTSLNTSSIPLSQIFG